MTTFNLQYKPEGLFYPHSLGLVRGRRFSETTTRFPPLVFRFITEAASDSGYKGRAF